MHLLDRTYQGNDLIVCIVRIFSALQYKRTEAQLISFTDTSEDLLVRQAVSLGICVLTVDAAVIAAVFTIVRELDEPADINGLAIDLFAYLPRAGG